MPSGSRTNQVLRTAHIQTSGVPARKKLPVQRHREDSSHGHWNNRVGIGSKETKRTRERPGSETKNPARPLLKLIRNCLNEILFQPTLKSPGCQSTLFAENFLLRPTSVRLHRPATSCRCEKPELC